jgi:hypothetical protein
MNGPLKKGTAMNGPHKKISVFSNYLSNLKSQYKYNLQSNRKRRSFIERLNLISIRLPAKITNRVSEVTSTFSINTRILLNNLKCYFNYFKKKPFKKGKMS